MFTKCMVLFVLTSITRESKSSYVSKRKKKDKAKSQLFINDDKHQRSLAQVEIAEKGSHSLFVFDQGQQTC